jgi:hypothetical protein
MFCGKGDILKDVTKTGQHVLRVSKMVIEEQMNRGGGSNNLKGDGTIFT